MSNDNLLVYAAKHLHLALVVLFEVIFQTALALVPTALRRKKSVQGETVLITGGGGGFGRLMAMEFAKLGARVVVWDINETSAEETCKLVREEVKGQIHAYKVDVSDRHNVYQAAKQVKTEVGQVTILINNAGVATSEFFMDTPDVQLDNLMRVNTMSQFWTCKAFLPDMLKANRGHVVCVASVASYVPLPKAASYSASKHALLGFMDALTLELKASQKDVKTTVVFPYFSNTGFCDVALNGLLDIVPPEDIVKDIMEGILIGKEMIYTPRRLAFSRYLTPLLSSACKWKTQLMLAGNGAYSSAKALTVPDTESLPCAVTLTEEDTAPLRTS